MGEKGLVFNARNCDNSPMVNRTEAVQAIHRKLGRRGGEAGFTIIETGIVIVVLGLMVAVGMPALQDWLDRYRVQRAAQTLAADLQLQRMCAVSRNVNHSIVFDAVNNTYTLWEGDPVNGLTTQLVPQPITLPFGVTFTDPIDDPIELSWAGNNDVAVFFPDGAVNGRLAQEDEITLSNVGGDAFRVTLHQVTGRTAVLEGAS